MKFTSLTNIVISAAAMAGVLAIASNSDTTPIGRSCVDNFRRHFCGLLGAGCILNLNNLMPYAVYCRSKGTVETATACGCQTCCRNGGNVKTI
ncbi:uncharacterized protein EDB93DRAFT_1119936, partial [Suillus bovinus]|uniref:uncharacterized protein n=1 Tax=Suillus bovinus TaxID=48563 RepID=UPI001B868CA7